MNMAMKTSTHPALFTIVFHRKLRVCISSLVCLASLAGLGGCHIAGLAFDALRTPDYVEGAVSELAYDVHPELGYTVYVEEGGAYAPYLVLTADYGGGTLLLREHLLEKTMPFKKNDSHMWSTHDYGAYYGDSSVDEYLNAGFLGSLGRSAQDAIVNSEIVITDKASMVAADETATTILRKVFLLSLLELNGPKNVFGYTAVREGKMLKYFSDDYNRRSATLANGVACPYWTRTPETWETYTVFVMAKDGGSGIGTADIDSGVRPAFCLENAAGVVQRTDIIDGQTVYAIE